MKRRTQGMFNQPLLHDTVMVKTCHFTLVNIYRMNKQSEPRLKIWTSVNNNVSTLMHQFVTNVPQ